MSHKSDFFFAFRSLLDDDFFSKLAKEAEKDDEVWHTLIIKAENTRIGAEVKHF